MRLVTLMAVVALLLIPIAVEAQCPCQPCKCDLCLCGFVSVQTQAKAEPKKLTVTCSNGCKVDFVFCDKMKMYRPVEKGWKYCPDEELWYPPAQATAPTAYQSFDGFQSSVGSCANGQCGSSGGRSGFFGRRR